MKNNKIEVNIVPLTPSEKVCFREGRKQAFEEELKSLMNILNTNDRFRIGEIEKRIEQIKKEMEE
jgi:hypothetical protein